MSIKGNAGGRIVVQKPDVSENNMLISRFECTGGIRSAFRTDTFFATYENVDLRRTPESLLVIPVLANLSPIAWAHGATVHVPTVDPAFLRSLGEVKRSLQGMYPQIPWGGNIVPESLAEPLTYPRGKSALLFSGGIDSLASYLVHRKENPMIVTALGRAPNNDLTDEVKSQFSRCSLFAQKVVARFAPVTTNLNRFLVPKCLPFGVGWWQKVQHGLAFLSLCAPLALHEHLGEVYLASTHTRDSGIPWGSHPSIDNNVAWGSTRGRHDGYHLSRQEKVALIAAHIKREDPDLTIQVCRRGARYGNCSACGKCCRTMIGLAVAGVDPNRHGFRLRRETLVSIRRQLSSRKFLRGANNRFMWKDIQRHIPEVPKVEIDGLRDFLHWFREFDID